MSTETRDGSSVPDLVDGDGNAGWRAESLQAMRQFLENDCRRQIARAQELGDTAEEQRLLGQLEELDRHRIKWGHTA